jgi:hypothetical protein
MLSKLVRSSGSAVRRSAAIAARSVGFAPPRLLCRRRGGADKGATHAGESLARSPLLRKEEGAREENVARQERRRLLWWSRPYKSSGGKEGPLHTVEAQLCRKLVPETQ